MNTATQTATRNIAPNACRVVLKSPLDDVKGTLQSVSLVREFRHFQVFTGIEHSLWTETRKLLYNPRNSI